ncbi:MAG TPA: GH25 family lysozyme [Kofleriaceae bacterium]|nr:GH25 family lysozyme [Kofleriaceae bacterium]
MPDSSLVSLGLDYASVDGNQPPDFAAARKAGARFMIPRAVYGRRVKGQTDPAPVFVDPVWARDKEAIRAAGLRRGAYLFVCYERTGVTTPPPEVQAQWYIDHVQLVRGEDFVPMFDVEEASDVLTANQMYDWTMRVCATLRKHYGAWPAMYTSARVWTENLKDHDASDLVECPLWITKPWPLEVRRPVDRTGALDCTPRTIAKFGDATNYWFYQYQGDGLGWPGFTSTTDVNRFHIVTRGANGTIVRWIQRRVGAGVDGDFGPNTEAAVKKFQRAHGLDDDGIIGPATFAALSWVAP